MSFQVIHTLFTVIVGLINVLLLRFLNRDWWQIRIVRYAVLAFPVLALLSLALIFFGRLQDSRAVSWSGSTLASIALVLIISSLAAFLISGITKLVYRIIAFIGKAGRNRPKSQQSMSRRTFLTGSLAALPVLTTGAGLGGMVSSFSLPKIREFEFKYENLPQQLAGFRILHLSDLHLGRYFKMPDLKLLLESLSTHKPNLILISGDICDVSSQLQETLDRISELNPSHGCYASLGNHEYYHGVKHSISVHSRSRVPLLIDNGLQLDVDGAGLYVGGADDPVRMFADVDDILSKSVSSALASARDTDFKIIMSHRPRGFIEASRRGVELTLAGHTHGAQMGIGGRSVFETTDPPNFFWGHYIRGKSQLYTSAGIGHWFPFRLGCAAEAPIITLRNSD